MLTDHLGKQNGINSIICFSIIETSDGISTFVFMQEPQGVIKMKHLLNRKEVLACINCSLDTLHRKIVAGELPRPLILGAKMRRWDTAVIDAY